MSLIATRIQDWRIQVPKFDENMHRVGTYGALDLFVSQTEAADSFITPELRNRAIQSIGTNIDIPVIDYNGNVTVSNVRSCTIEDAENTSALYRVVFATYAVGFTQTPVLYHNNDIGYARDFNAKMTAHISALAKTLDVAAIAALETNKTQVFGDKLFYDESANTLGVKWDYRENFMGDIPVLFNANDYSFGDIHLVSNSGIESNIRKMAEWGANNSQNKQLQYADKFFHFTNNLTNEDSVFATAFAVRGNQLGYLTRSGRENLARTRSNDTEWDIVNMPILNMPVDTYYYTDKGDKSTLAGEASSDMNCVITEHFGFWIDVAFIVKYNSDPDIVANPIIKFEVLNSDCDNWMAAPVKTVCGAGSSQTNPLYTQAVTAP
ncbi:MAG: hypothetical protein LBP67_05015 [Bacteroidales bacterium]|jgi:hypothetical protein|nr:hypothetical protein [Bacteroidales bacterium]